MVLNVGYRFLLNSKVWQILKDPSTSGHVIFGLCSPSWMPTKINPWTSDIGPGWATGLIPSNRIDWWWRIDYGSKFQVGWSIHGAIWASKEGPQGLDQELNKIWAPNSPNYYDASCCQGQYWPKTEKSGGLFAITENSVTQKVRTCHFFGLF